MVKTVKIYREVMETATAEQEVTGKFAEVNKNQTEGQSIKEFYVKNVVRQGPVITTGIQLSTRTCDKEGQTKQ